MFQQLTTPTSKPTVHSRVYIMIYFRQNSQSQGISCRRMQAAIHPLPEGLSLPTFFEFVNKANCGTLGAKNPARGCLLIATVAQPPISLFVFRRREMRKSQNRRFGLE